MPGAPSSKAGYAIALVTSVLGVAVGFVVQHAGAPASFMPLFIPVLFASWYGGVGPGLFATGLACMSILFWFTALTSRTGMAIEAFRIGMFLLVAVLISVNTGRMARSVSRLEAESNQRRRSETRLRIAADAAKMGIFERVSGSRSVIWENDWMYRIFGRDARKGPLTHDEYIAVIHPDDVPSLRSARDAAARSIDGRFAVRIRITRENDQALRWIEVRGQTEPVHAGAPVTMIGTVTDVTDQVAAEQDLARADRHKNEFLAMLAHELRNPLGPIRNAIAVLKQTDLPSTKHVLWARDLIDRQTAQLARLVDDLIDVSRVSTGKIALTMEPVDLAQVVSHAVEAVRPDFNTKQHRLSLSLPAEPPIVLGDAARLAQVLGNLLDNAGKYTPPGGAIDVSLVVDDGCYVLTVQDNGVGIEPTVLPTIFGLFVQDDQSLDRSQGGLGIGLSVVERIVQKHGGQVWAESAGRGHGSRFVVRLPGIPALAPEGTRALHGRAPAQDGKRVLVVDDNQDAVETVKALLEIAGHTVAVAYDGAAALDAVPRFEPEVVVLDIGLPILTGFQVAIAIRADHGIAQPFLIALTGYGDAAKRAMGRESGFDEYLVKPVDPVTLLQRVADTNAKALHSH